jgi:xylan 1,4-beta-xylosidase
MKKCAMFMTHHSPVGAWSSLTFGFPGRAAGIDSECNADSRNAELLVAVGRRGGKTKAFPFFSGLKREERKVKLFRSLNLKDHWRFIGPEKITRTLSPCVDEYRAEEMTLRVYTPHPSLPDPDKKGSLKYATCPGLLLELDIDNTGSDKPAYGFIGMEYISIGTIHRLEGTPDNKLAGVGVSSGWALAARPVPGKVFPCIRENSIARYVKTCEEAEDLFGKEGGVVAKVPAGKKGSFLFAFGFYRQGNATQGIEGPYYYTKYFSRAEEVCGYVLDNALRIKNECALTDGYFERLCRDERRVQLFSQAVRSYYANNQLIESCGKPYFNINEGIFGYRNTLDLCADHLPWELFWNPWVVRNMTDNYIEKYSYTDRLTFPSAKGKTFPGGLTFTHDMGNSTMFSPLGKSCYEHSDPDRGCNFMTTEELLNGIYCLAGYALAGNDKKWNSKRRSAALRLMSSLENRDHYDPSKRTGVLKANSTKCAGFGGEITTYDCLDSSLKSSQGSIYIAVKTWCACLMLEAFFKKAGDKGGAARARKMADRAARSLLAGFNAKEKCFPANLFNRSDSKIISAIEPLGVPYFLGLKNELFSYGELISLLKQHALTCFAKGNCIDRKTGGMRLSSTSANTWPSKTSLCLFVAEEILGINLDAYPTLMRELLYWTQVAAGEITISDQILADKRAVGDYEGRYYPRIVTSFLLLKPELKP